MSRKTSFKNHPAASRKRVSSAVKSVYASDTVHRTYLPILICFTLSGSTGLIYQILWTRLLVLVFGSATAATATILAVFMGGLALGSAAAGRIADRIARPIWIYGLLEGMIGLYALLVPALLTLSESAYRWGWQTLGGASGSLAFLRLGLTAVILLPPTIFMGATLPLLSRAVSENPEASSARIGALYSANLLGAIAGAAVGGFILLPTLGMRRTLLASALVNFLLLAAAWALDRWSAPKSTQAKDKPAEPRSLESQPESVVLSRGAWIALLCFSVSGALAMLYEVAWTRALGLIIGSHSYAFTVMVTAFLGGLFLGTAAASRVVARTRAPLRALGLLQIAAAVYTLVAYVIFNWLPWWNLRLFDLLPRSSEYALAARFLLSTLILLPPAVCFGAVFPFAVRGFGVGHSLVGYGVGRLYAGNTLGAIVGALVAGFWLVPRLGVQNTLRSAIVVQCFVGLVVIWMTLRKPSLRRAAVLTGVGFGAIALVAFTPRWNDVTLVMAQTARRAVADLTTFPYASRAQFLQELTGDQKVLFSWDGATSHVAVVENPVNRSLLTNGHADASDRADLPNQILLSALPLLLHTSSAPERVAVIGWGSGVTAGAALCFPIRSLIGIELEPMVLRASEWFRTVSHDALHDPRVKMVIGDARNYFLATPDRFDVIISEPSNAWQAGVCNLFTQEFFARARHRLKVDGLFTAWIGYGGIPASEVRGVLAALHAVFPHILLFRSTGYDLIAVASPAPIRISLEQVAARMQWPSVKAELERAKTPSMARLLARLQAGDAEVETLIAGERPNTDDNARLEYTVARVYELGAQGPEMNAALKQINTSALARYLAFGGLPDATRQAALRALNGGDSNR